MVEPNQEKPRATKRDELLQEMFQKHNRLCQYLYA